MLVGLEIACLLRNSESLKILFTCFEDALNLPVGNLVKSIWFLRDSTGTTYGISNLVKKSPKREATLQKCRGDVALEYPRFRILCPAKRIIKKYSQ